MRALSIVAAVALLGGCDSTSTGVDQGPPGVDGGGGADLVEPPLGQPAILRFDATPAFVPPGTSSTLSWTVEGADRVTLDGADVAAADSRPVSPVATTTYVLEASNARGTVRAMATVTLRALVTPGDPGAADERTDVDTSAERKPISRLIYGYNNYSPGGTRPKNLTLDRRGGDRYCAYNWETNASSSGGSDTTYFYLNDGYLSSSTSPAAASFAAIDANRGRAMATMMLVQLGDYVAGDRSGAVDITNSTYLSHFKRLRLDGGSDPAVMPSAPNAGDATVSMDEYVNYVRWHYAGVADLFTSATAPLVIGLDNEPDLWHSAFAILQRSPTGPAIPRTGSLSGWKTPANDTELGRSVTPDELIARVKTITTMLRRVAPQAEIHGPSHYGFDGMELFAGSWPGLSTTYWFTDKFLTEMAAASTAAGKRLLDVYNFHWYPEAYAGGTRIIDLVTPADDAGFDAIAQNPRSYWDPTYDENSWITRDHTMGPVRIVTRVQEKIAARWPGTKLAITEYYPGGGGSIAGGIAEADTLGIFGRLGLHAAALWVIPFTDSDARFVHGGMKMFRDYDGQSGSFGDTSVRAQHSTVAGGSAYASVDNASDDRVVVVLINRTKTARTTALRVTHTQALRTAEVYTLTQASANPVRQADLTLSTVNALVYAMPARSVTTLVLRP